MPTWILSSPHLTRTVVFDDGAGLRTTALVNRVNGSDLLARYRDTQPPEPEFSFWIDGQPLTALDAGWTLASVTWGPSKLHLVLRHAAYMLAVDVTYEADGDYPVMSKYLVIQTHGDSAATLSRLRIESLLLAPGAPEELSVQAGYGVTPRELYYGGRAEDVLFVQANTRTGEGFAAYSDVPGFLKCYETSWRWTGGITLGYDSSLFPFEYRLTGPFTSARAYIALFHDVESQVCLRQALQTVGERREDNPSLRSLSLSQPSPLRREGLEEETVDAACPWFYNTWEVFYGDIDAQTVHELIPIAARLGIDIFTIDDGWQAHYGDNAVDAARFPDGLDAIRAEVAAAGMRLGLWVPLAAVSEHAPVYRQHPDWVCLDTNGAPKVTFTPAGDRYVMCLASDYRRHAADRLIALVEHYKLAYLKVDLTTVFNVYGEQPGCTADGHDHATWAESLVRIYEAMAWIADQVHAAHPNVLIDYTFELWGQKHLIDHGLLCAADLDWLSNVKDKADGSSGPLLARTLLYQRALAVPVESMLIGNLEANWQPVEERFATVIGSAPLLMGDLRRLTEAQQAWYAGKIAWFKALRRAVPLHESFYPLGSWQQPAITRWDGFARLSKDGEGVIVIFRNDSGIETVEIALPAFDAAASFHLRSVMRGRDLGNVQGAHLRTGWRLAFDADARVEIIEVRRGDAA